ncbi:hypothetical protein ACP0HM_25835 [Escherichia coli]
MLRGLSKLRNLGQGYVNFGEPMPLMTYLNQRTYQTGVNLSIPSKRCVRHG